MSINTAVMKKLHLTGFKLTSVFTVFVIFSHSWQTCCSLGIRVSQKFGSDITTCLGSSDSNGPYTTNSACWSLEFALQGLNILELRNETELRIVMIDDTYALGHRVKVIQPRSQISLFIESSCTDSCATIFSCTDPEAGITIGSQFGEEMAQNVVFRNLVFRGCGPTLASTVLIWNSRDISFSGCAFENNLQAAINAMDSSVTIEKCSFINNTCNRNAKNESSYASEHFTPGITSQSGGTGFLFTNSTNLSVAIKDSYYSNNSGVVHKGNFYVAPSSKLTYFGDGGGAITVTYSSQSSGCVTNMDNLTFTGNSATYGGALFFLATEQANGNALNLVRSVFSDNVAGQAGGAVCTSQWDQAKKTLVLIDGCTMERNSAPRGGGLNAFFMSYVGLYDSKFRIRRLLARWNVAQSAPGLRFTSSLPYGDLPGSVIELIDSEISHHVSCPCSTHTYLAPITIQRLNIHTFGLNEIKNNRGAGGMVVEHGLLHVEGRLIFTNNTGSMGGGLRIWSSQIKVYPHSELVFIDNHVTSNGGALSVELFPNYEVIHKYNADCFITYSQPSTPPSQWKTKIVFAKNSAKLKGSAIYATTLASCLWDEQFPYYSVERSLRWDNNTFVYLENYLTNGVNKAYGRMYEIATDTAAIEPETNSSNNIELYPGEQINLHLHGRDELGHTVYTIADVLVSLPANHTQEVVLPNTLHVLSTATNNNSLQFVYSAKGSKSYHDMIGKTHKITVAGVYSSTTMDYSFNLKTVACSPGYKFEKTVCICDKSVPGVLRCDGERTVYLKEGYWAGLSTRTGKLITYYCPFKYCHCKRNKDDDMPGCMLDTKNFTAQCSNGREGILCGQCSKGLSVGLRLYECIDCKGSGWILGIVVVLVVALCILTIYLNPSISKDLRGPLFFFQMLPFIFKPSDKVGNIVKFVAYSFQFGGPLVYVWKTCITHGISNLYALAIEYMMPLTTLLIFLVAYILSVKRVIRTKLRKTSSLQSFWLIILFMYIYLVETSLLILHCPFIDNEMRFFYDGNVKCFHGKHLVMSVVALLVLVTLVIPPPLAIILLTKGYWKVDTQYLSTLMEGLRPHCLWWWAVDFGRRILIVGTFVFIPVWKTKQVWMVIMSLVVLAVHSNFQPYKRLRTNITESVYLFVLCLLTIVQMMEDEDTRVNISAGLLVLAILHSSILCMYKFWRFCRKKCQCECVTPLTKYGSFDDDNSERTQVDPEIQAKQNLFDSVFASAEMENSSRSN